MRLKYFDKKQKTFTSNMDLLFFRNGKTEQNSALISKFGILRVKMKIAKELNFNNDERYLVGIDKNEDAPKYIYVLKYKSPASELDKDIGWQTKYNNNSWSVSFKTVVKELNLQERLPMWLRVEPFNDDTYIGFRLLIPENK
jgi:hypothetical protein